MNPMKSNKNQSVKSVQCYTWEMRMSKNKSDGSQYDYKDVGNMLMGIAKKFVFQLERGHETNYEHYQIRCSLIKKMIKKSLLDLIVDKLKCAVGDAPQYIEPSVKEVHDNKNFDYVLKDDTRILGPWTDKEFKHEILKEPEYIPVQYRGIKDKLYPYQKIIFDSADQLDIRNINMIVDTTGNNGKSTISSICELFGRGIDLPPLNDMKEIVQILCDECMSMNIRNPSPILVDMPRAMTKERLYGFFSGLEQIKKGKLYDPRHNYKKFWIDSPQVWVFSNVYPDLKMLSLDRWVIWNINEKKELVRVDVNRIGEKIKEIKEDENNNDIKKKLSINII